MNSKRGSDRYRLYLSVIVIFSREEILISLSNMHNGILAFQLLYWKGGEVSVVCLIVIAAVR